MSVYSKPSSLQEEINKESNQEIGVLFSGWLKSYTRAKLCSTFANRGTKKIWRKCLDLKLTSRNIVRAA